MALIVGGTTVTGTQTLVASTLTGNIADARVPSSAVTQHVSATTNTKGNWTPASGGSGGGGFNIVEARYNRIGNVVHWFCWVQWTSRPNNNTSVWYLTGLPITSANEGNTYSGFATLKGKSHTHCTGVIPKNSTYVRWSREPDGRNLTEASNEGTQFEGQHAYATSGGGTTVNDNGYGSNMYIEGYYSV